MFISEVPHCTHGFVNIPGFKIFNIYHIQFYEGNLIVTENDVFFDLWKNAVLVRAVMFKRH